jgi:protein SCO1/2
VSLAALAVIVVVTVGWWALALYPAGQAAPEWLARTRLACFGAAPGGLPNAGGWILLVGEPIGMLAILVAVWGDALRRDLRAVATRRWGPALLWTLAACLGLSVAGTAVFVFRVAQQGAETFAANVPREQWAPAEQGVPALRLTDQHGRAFDLASLRGRPALVTFAFSHCATACPTLVRQVRRLREDAKAERVPLVIVTVDPWRDVPARLPTIAREWNLAPGDVVLSGSIPEVNRVLDDWGVGRTRDETTGDLAHATVVLLVHRDGRRASRMDGGVEALTRLLSAE